MGVLWGFFLSSLLLTNAVCILHEKRFLRKYGWDKVDASQGMTIRNQVVGFLVAVQYLRGLPFAAFRVSSELTMTHIEQTLNA
ncbi:hypothetical protein P43SY_007014 [Pythium insidiosum]|uniref:Immediate early response 3-interacting protein 1 n=1 Tax=Pythium insidiosum TaxID=114742 RepID=A0AAD5LMD6_PYTIN|nr:hypothetical protein P43SY_007014 [Pythium insidiosum]